MFRNLTIGQHYPVDSPVHSLDPRLKIVFTIIFIISLFLIESFLGFLIVAVFLTVVITISKVPLKFVIKGLRPILFIILVTFLINLLMTPGRVIFTLGFIKITEEGLRQAGFMAVRLTLLIMGTSLLTLTTSPILLTDGIEALLKPFSRFGLPAHELAMMMTIALRFIPTLMEETEKIMKAQKSRGADFESGNIVSRAKNLVPLLVPLFISAFRRADELAMAMEARCYRGGVNRTRMRQMKITRGDYAAAFIFTVYIAAIIMFRIW
ncbi:MAG TPA: energy-coupling factor transporter transmembrane component T [Sedimentibacter sp.]|jgi:energy-coupling factor transport system permease protein|nr:energy-coupling factor transporter transmembrane protein EcfT [Sedimentibacter sp.]HOK49034.1 energy-coupling factor transporter transmembrane component T [Sedimentibacter sp.]HOW22143.1 energy-coupling factor transporter transmembrane component T [Sedimentibacter sp.]HRC79783.1 energy-coupling factor transporter transmembrane component T [Sedimentibacter sp.]